MTPIESLHEDLERVFAGRLESFLTFGPGAAEIAATGKGDASRRGNFVHTLVVVVSLTASDLASCARRSSGWTRRGLATPLILGAEELVRSLDAFPLEFMEIIATRRMVAGRDPFLSVEVNPEDIRRACEVQARSHLLHLRQAYVEAAGQTAAIARLVAASAVPFKALLINVARMEGADWASAGALAAYVRAMGLPVRLSTELETPAPAARIRRADAAHMYLEYLEAAERVVDHVDRLVRS